MINFNNSQRPDLDNESSNPQENSVDRERSRIGSMWDGVLQAGVTVAREGENVADAVADATPPIANSVHKLGKASKDLLVGIFTGRAGK